MAWQQRVTPLLCVPREIFAIEDCNILTNEVLRSFDSLGNKSRTKSEKNQERTQEIRKSWDRLPGSTPR